MKWDPTVRTRHLTVLAAVLLLAVGALLCFNLSRLLAAQLAARQQAMEVLADQFQEIAQQTISRPEDPLAAISQDPALKLLVKTSAGERKDFAYYAVVAAKGAEIAQTDPQGLRRRPELIAPLAELEQAPWYRQFWLLWRGQLVYELQSSINLDEKPFLNVLAGVTTASLRSALWPSLRLNLIFAFVLILLSMLLAAFSSNTVLKPLRELISSIEQLERESLAHGGAAAAHGEPAHDTQNLTQRLRELGRRFAGSRTEIEAIRDQLQQVVGNLTERVLLLDRHQRVIMASPEAEKLLSNGHFVLRGQRLSDMLSRTHPLSVITERAYATGKSLQEMATFASNGAGRPHTILASLQLFEDRGQPAGALLTLRDFETLQRLETQLDFASKLAALNRITAGVAHEVKNPLHSMVLHLELLSAKLDAGLDPKSHLEILTSEVNRLKRVVQTFLDFTRPVELKLVQVDANVLLREVILLAADARAQGVDLIEQYAPGPLFIKADADMLKQALLNIIINGCQVMPDGGKLTVETGRDDEGLVYIAVTDTGPGIPEEVRDKIFNLYYTTKPKGSGIGLAQAFRAVQLHNGRIRAESEVGKGTCFRLLLPAA